ncbi:MAG: hypothetical protein GKR99_13810 [Rhodobacteraceae bacterium]|nr:hypothetical protein [Paracoccaceae bacterium]
MGREMQTYWQLLRSSSGWFFSALIAAFIVVASLPAEARNVPGSTTSVTDELSEASTDILVRDVKSALRKLRPDDREPASEFSFSPGVTRNDGQGDLTGLSGSAVGPTFSVFADASFRAIEDTDDLDYDMAAGALVLTYRTAPGSQIFGGLIFEDGDGTTPFNSGTLESEGRGFTLGFDHQLADDVYVTLVLGRLDLDYDFSRSAGAITGSFGAERIFADLTVEALLHGASTQTTLGFGLRHVKQDNDGYVENGGGAVAASSFESSSLVLASRTDFTDTMNGGSPFIEADLRHDFSGESLLPPGVFDPDQEETHLRLGFGVALSGPSHEIEAGIGANFNEDGRAGYDARAQVHFRF